MILNEVNPPLDELMHHGVKGMKWGVRKSGYPSGRTIRTARKNVEKDRVSVSRQRRKAVVSTVKRSSSAPHDRAKLKSMKVAQLNNPDRVTALKLTKGESAVHVLLLAHPATAAVTVPSLVTREVVARTVARRQKTGSYNKK